MKTSENGAPILSGSGLKTVRERIEKRFAEARDAGPTSLVPAKPKDAADGSPPQSDMQLAVIPEPRPSRPLADIAAPLLLEIRATGMPHRNKDAAACWDIGDAPVVDSVNELFDAALIALGYQPEKSPMDLLRTCMAGEPKKKSMWSRDIFQRVVR